MTDGITLPLWALIAIGCGIILVCLLVFVFILVGLNSKWRKEYAKLSNSINIAVLSENADLRAKLKDEADFKEHLRQDLDKAIKILKVQVKPVDNELVQLWVSKKNIPLLNERFVSYSEWIYPTEPETDLVSELDAEADLETGSEDGSEKVVG